MSDELTVTITYDSATSPQAIVASLPVWADAEIAEVQA